MGKTFRHGSDFGPRKKNKPKRLKGSRKSNSQQKDGGGNYHKDGAPSFGRFQSKKGK